MKYLIAIFTLTFLLISCGGNKTEETKPEEVTEQVEQTTPEATETVEQAPAVEEKVEEVKEVAQTGVTEPASTKKTEELASGVNKVTKGKGEWSGNVVMLSNFVTGSAKNLTKEEAVASVKGKQMIAFVVDGTPYLVFNTDGSYANKALATALADGIVNIKGKMNVVGGMNTIIADIIE